jgi:hypothetical protein
MRATFFAGLCLLAITSGVATQPAPRTLEFLAVARDGQPVPDLTNADIDLKIAGKTATVTALEHVAPPDGGRHILLLLEEATVYGLEPVVRDGVKTLLASLLPGDQVLLVSTRRPAASVIRGREAVTKVVESLDAGPGDLYSCLSDTLTNIERMLDNLPQGRASTLIVLARGHDEGAATGSEGDAAPCTPRRDAMRKMSERLAAAQVTLMFFTVHPTNRSWGFETLASNLASTSRLLTWADTKALAKAVAETRGFYRVTFDAGPALQDRPQRVELKTKRRNTRIHVSPLLATKADSK